MKRIALLSSVACLFLAGCSSSNSSDATAPPTATQAKQEMGAKATTGMAPNAVAAPPGVSIGDHRGGMAGGSIPGVPGKR